MSIKASLKATKSMTGTAAAAMGLMTKASYTKMYGDIKREGSASLFFLCLITHLRYNEYTISL